MGLTPPSQWTGSAHANVLLPEDGLRATQWQAPIPYATIYSSITLLAALGSWVKVEGAASTLMSSYWASLEVWWLMTTSVEIFTFFFFYLGNHGSDEWAMVQWPKSKWPANIWGKGLEVPEHFLSEIYLISPASMFSTLPMTYTTCIKQRVLQPK